MARSRKMKLAHIEDCFERLAAVLPQPKTELDYRDHYTLLVAVVLSAQATDVGVNRATKGLYAAADTPQAMVDLGVDGIAHHIRTIGLFNTKAKNVHRLSEILLESHGGIVPDDRAALQALPGVGRKTANVVLNEAFGHPTIAVDTHIFRVGNRTGMAPGDAGRCRGRACAPGSRCLEERRASLADPAWPLCLQGAQAGMLAMHDCRILQLSGQDTAGRLGSVLSFHVQDWPVQVRPGRGRPAPGDRPQRQARHQ